MSRILIVDDYEDLTHVMRIYLESVGYEVSECYRSEDLFNKIYSTSPDLILLDIFLNGESGRSLCTKIKSLQSLKDIRVILFSAHVFEPEFLADVACDDFIQKPFDLDELKSKIELQLKLKQEIKE